MTEFRVQLVEGGAVIREVFLDAADSSEAQDLAFVMLLSQGRPEVLAVMIEAAPEPQGHPLGRHAVASDIPTYPTSRSPERRSNL